MIQESRVGCISFACLIATWTLLWFLISSGMNSHSNTWWDKVWIFSGLLGAPIAALLAIAGILIDRKKPVASVALLLSLLSTLVILSIGG